MYAKWVSIRIHQYIEERNEYNGITVEKDLDLFKICEEDFQVSKQRIKYDVIDKLTRFNKHDLL